jgi:Fe-S oxidoreductase
MRAIRAGKEERFVVDSDEIARALQVLAQRLTRQLEASLHACAHCGLCNDSCHYFLALSEPAMVPTFKADRLRNVWKRRYDWLGRVWPWYVGAQELDDGVIAQLVDTAFGACTMCGRCVLNCPLGVDTRLIIRTARAMLNAIGLTPRGLQDTVEVHLRAKNNMGVDDTDFRETIAWLDEQLQEELGVAGPIIPLDKQGARVMYLVNPREVKFYPLSLMAAAKVMYVAGEDWTMSTAYWDVTNYALFSGDDAAARQIGLWALEAAVQLGVQEVWMSECGHGYRAFRWEAENWLGRPFPFRVRGFVEPMAEYIRDGRIRLDPARNAQPVTYHDPCNQARNGGILEEPRYILSRAVTDFREMVPNREHNHCCGGGGGMLSMTEFTPRRLAAAQVKATQIQDTGAKIVATSCHNCLDQLADVNRKYKLGAPARNLCELVADALVWEPGPAGT